MWFQNRRMKERHSVVKSDLLKCQMDITRAITKCDKEESETDDEIDVEKE